MESYDVIGSLEKYREYQKELAGILDGAAEVTGSLKMSKDKELAELSGKVLNDTFKIMVTGTFKNGKSTFINALLGEEILPAYALPCTAVINEIKYGTEKRAILYFKDPLPNPLPDKLAEKALRHMERHNGKKIPPMEIPYDEIEDYVVIPMGMDAKQMKLQSPYEKVELFYPLNILKNGVEIIDSPGLNEDETRTKVTMNYLQKIDAILYVLNATAICAGDEMKFVENDLRGNNIDSVFFVVNKFDLLGSRDQPQIRQYAEIKLKEFYPNPALFCLSAANALNGRMAKDDVRIEESGIVPLEKSLTEFLTNEKGKAKLASPAKQVRQILSREALEVVIPRKRELLASSLDDVKQKYERIKPKLELAVREKEQKEGELFAKIEYCCRKFEHLVKKNIREMIDSVPVWIDEFKPATALGLLPSREKTEKAVEEISGYLEEKINEAQREWKEAVLIPEIEEETGVIFREAEEDISDIFREIDDINLELAGKEYNANPVPFWKRVAGVAGGLVIGDIGLACSGGVNGIGKEFAKTAAFEVGAGFVLGMLGLVNPFTLAAIIVGAFLYNIGKGSSKAMEKLKSQMSEQVITSMAETADQQAAEQADAIKEKMESVARQIIDSVSKELNDIDAQVRAVIAEKEKGEQSVEVDRKELSRCETKIHDLNARLDTLIFTLVGA